MAVVVPVTRAVAVALAAGVALAVALALALAAGATLAVAARVALTLALAARVALTLALTLALIWALALALALALTRAVALAAVVAVAPATPAPTLALSGVAVWTAVRERDADRRQDAAAGSDRHRQSWLQPRAASTDGLRGGHQPLRDRSGGIRAFAANIG
jgi:hypothetical protein